jgi:ABC-2 type transport system ATP-binding protein
VALGTPLGLRQEHTEHKVDVILADGARLVYDLGRSEERQALAEHVCGGRIASLQTREFDFHQAFLKLTGTEFT